MYSLPPPSYDESTRQSPSTLYPNLQSLNHDGHEYRRQPTAPEDPNSIILPPTAPPGSVEMPSLPTPIAGVFIPFDDALVPPYIRQPIYCQTSQIPGAFVPIPSPRINSDSIDGTESTAGNHGGSSHSCKFICGFVLVFIVIILAISIVGALRSQY